MSKNTIDQLIRRFKGKPTFRAIRRRDPRVYSVRVYHDGFVSNAYKWPAPGEFTDYWLGDDGKTILTYAGTYDRKRAHGRGPDVVVMSDKGGRLYSW